LNFSGREDLEHQRSSLKDILFKVDLGDALDSRMFSTLKGTFWEVQKKGEEYDSGLSVYFPEDGRSLMFAERCFFPSEDSGVRLIQFGKINLSSGDYLAEDPVSKILRLKNLFSYEAPFGKLLNLRIKDHRMELFVGARLGEGIFLSSESHKLREIRYDSPRIEEFFKWKFSEMNGKEPESSIVIGSSLDEKPKNWDYLEFSGSFNSRRGIVSKQDLYSFLSGGWENKDSTPPSQDVLFDSCGICISEQGEQTERMIIKDLFCLESLEAKVDDHYKFSGEGLNSSPQNLSLELLDNGGILFDYDGISGEFRRITSPTQRFYYFPSDSLPEF